MVYFMAFYGIIIGVKAVNPIHHIPYPIHRSGEKRTYRAEQRNGSQTQQIHTLRGNATHPHKTRKAHKIPYNLFTTLNTSLTKDKTLREINGK